MNEEDVEKISIILFMAVMMALRKRHGWTEADAQQLVAEAKEEAAILTEAMDRALAQ